MENGEKQNLNTQPVSEQPTPASIPELEKKSILHSKWLKIGVIVVILSILLGGVYMLGKNGLNKQSPTPTSVSEATSTPTPIPDPTANWKTYSPADKQLFGDVTFKYPQGWVVTVHADLIRILPPGVHEADEFGNPPINADFISFQARGADSEECGEGCPTIDKKSKTVINGKTVDITDGHFPMYGYRFEQLTFNTNGSYDSFTLQNSDLNSLPQDKIQTLFKIAATFKFTIQTASPTPGDITANWKTYSNTDYHFSIKYPSTLSVKVEKDSTPTTNCHNESVQSVYNNMKFTTGHLVQGMEDYWGFGVIVTPTNGRTITNEFEGCKSMDATIHVVSNTNTAGADEAADIQNSQFIKVYRIGGNFFELSHFQNELPPPDPKDQTPTDIRNIIMSTFKFTQ